MKFTVSRPTEIEISFVEMVLPVNYDEEEIPNDFPGREGEQLKLTVAIDNGEIQGWPKGRKESVHLTVKDGGEYYLKNHAGEVVAERHDYVPHGLIPGEYGDVILMEINESGRITNWRQSPSVADFFDED